MHEMRTFLTIAARHLHRPIQSKLSLNPIGTESSSKVRSSSTFTTLGDLECDAVYYRGELPLESELTEQYVADFAWGSCGPIAYKEIAHVLIPRFFTEEAWTQYGSQTEPRLVNQWIHEQDIAGLSDLLSSSGIDHSMTDQVLELKRF